MSLLGSREQLCVHPNISKLRGSVLNHACNTANSSAEKKCSFKLNLEGYIAQEAIDNSILDIEDLVKKGVQKRICPYFYSRDLSEKADLILLPYNYLIDDSIRKTLKINWNNAVVIFDEAHNLERIASDAASFTWSSLDIAQCVVELKNLLGKFQQNSSERLNESSSTSTTQSNTSSDKQYPTIDQVIYLLKAMFAVDERIDSIPLSASGPGSTPSAVLPGDWLPQMLEECGFSCPDIYRHVEALARCSFMIMDEAEKLMGGLSPLSITEPKLTHFANSLKRVFRSKVRQENNLKLMDYKVFVCEAEPNKSDARSHLIQNRLKPKRLLNFWAFSSGIAMEELMLKGIRSFLLTSGTMSPMESFKEDMKIKFPVCIQNPHVIQDKQIWIGSFGTGTSGKQLNSSYNVAQTNEYKDELGESILKICQTMLGRGGGSLQGPELKGGVLVFFPSYISMDTVVKRWKETSLFQKLKVVGGDIVIEPKGSMKDGGIANRLANTSKPNETKKAGFGEDLKKNKTLDSDETGTSDEKLLAGVVTDFENALKSKGRCLLFAVCRGKVSEGIDFYDEKGRVVIITGLPYAPYLDPWVVLKKNYMDERCNKAVANQLITPMATNKASTSYSSVYNNADAFMSTLKPQIPSTSIYPPPPLVYPPPPPQNVKPNQSSLMPPPAAKSVFKLDGKAWYDQSASRAVNQAIGRVIRHRKDWGAIFLLDDRFLKDSQKAQLSGWVRGRLIKYTQFNNGMENFRKFISGAMSDPELCAHSKNVKVKKNVTSYDPKNGIDDSEISRTIVIQRSELNETEDNSFLDPEKLLTQNVESRARINIGYGHDDNDDDLDDMVNKIKRSSSYNSDNSFSQSSSNAGNTFKRSTSTDKKGTLTSMFARIENNNQTSNVSTIKNVPIKKQSAFVLQSTLSKTGNKSASNEPRSSIFGLGSMKTIQSKVNSENDRNISNKPDNDNAAKGGENLLKIIDDIRASLSIESFEKFKNIIKTTKENNGGLKQANQINDFVRNLMPLFSSVDSVIAEALMLRLTILIPPNFMNLKEQFRDSVRKIYLKPDLQPTIDAAAAVIKEVDSKKRPAESSTSNDKDRMKQIKVESSSTQNLSQAKSPQSILSQQSTVVSRGGDSSNVQRIFQPSGRSQKMIEASLSGHSSNKSSQSSNTKSFLCVICKEVPDSPCAAKLCGHICCSTCWLQWLKVKQVCPSCRKPVSKSNLTKIILEN